MVDSFGFLSFFKFAGLFKIGSSPLRRKRPDGKVIWLHAGEMDREDTIFELLERAVAARPGTRLLITIFSPAAMPFENPENAIVEQMAGAKMSDPKAFMTHWAPNICIWSSKETHWGLFRQIHRRGMPMFLANENSFIPARKMETHGFSGILSNLKILLGPRFVRTSATSGYFRKIGSGRKIKVHLLGQVASGMTCLPFYEADRDELSILLRGRPVWLAANIDRNEIDTVLAANGIVSKMAHRTLLILNPKDINDIPDCIRSLEERGMSYVLWSKGEFPQQTSQVLLADSLDDMGLWYSLAATTFMGGSLRNGGFGADPNEPAAHGSAILHGPYVESYKQRYSRFADAGAALPVHDSDSMAEQVLNLMPPDKSSIMAHAAWEVASKEALEMERIIVRIHDRLDGMEVE
ncbi:MAG: hypothetical protein OXD29_11645 [Roseovarius sp.]|nr:hypothetical protein [Roseovarius sp.]MCY4208588.1 hypothetical protein [Roseovarius sp.]